MHRFLYIGLIPFITSCAALPEFFKVAEEVAEVGLEIAEEEKTVHIKIELEQKKEVEKEKEDAVA